jgi:hypothetical protein
LALGIRAVVYVSIVVSAAAAAAVRELVGLLDKGYIEEMRWDTRRLVLNWAVAGMVALAAPHQLVQMEDQFLLAEGGPC